MTIQKGNVFFFYISLAKCFEKLLTKGTIFSKDKCTSSIFIKPVDEQCFHLFFKPRIRRYTCRLVVDQYMLIFKQDGAFSLLHLFRNNQLNAITFFDTRVMEFFF